MKATLVLLDEGGYCLVSPLKRTWAPCGQTPVIHTSLDHHQRLNLFGAVIVPYDMQHLDLAVRSYKCSLTGVQVVAFLKQLLAKIPGEIIVVLDHHAIHQRGLVQDFVKGEPRLQIEWLPRCAPELNPAEFIWTQLNEHTASTAPRNLQELRKNVFSGIAKIRNSQARLQYCLIASALSWK